MSKLSLTPVEQDEIPTAETEEVVTFEEMQDQNSTTDNQGPVETETAESNTEADDIPEKFKGKSMAEVVRAYQEVESALSRQGQEVGKARKDLEQYQKIMDQYITSQTLNQQNTQHQAEESVESDDEIDFFTDPDKAVQAQVRKALENNPDLQSAKALQQEITKQSAVAQLSKDHPDWQQLAADSQFSEWVQGSQFRMQLAAKADQYDYAAANELFSMYKERAGYQQAAKAEATGERKQAVQKASTGSAQGSGESRGKRTYKRSDIRELMIKDPSRYRQIEPDLRQAYAEGRVIGT